jgi:hypothetical protein
MDLAKRTDFILKPTDHDPITNEMIVKQDSEAGFQPKTNEQNT